MLLFEVLCLLDDGLVMSIFAPISCCTLKLRSYCSITCERPDSTRIVCADVKSLYIDSENVRWTVLDGDESVPKRHQRNRRSDQR